MKDSDIKLFDLRSAKAMATFGSNEVQSVRDVQFSPHNQYNFASVAENGCVSVWDTRRPDRHDRKWTAHAENIFTCDWHPEVRKRLLHNMIT